MKTKAMIGKRFDSFSLLEQKEINAMISGGYYGMNFNIKPKTPTEAGEYDITIDLCNGLSVPGTLLVTEDEAIEYINNDGVFYDPTQ